MCLAQRRRKPVGRDPGGAGRGCDELPWCCSRILILHTYIHISIGGSRRGYFCGILCLFFLSFLVITTGLVLIKYYYWNSWTFCGGQRRRFYIYYLRWDSTYDFTTASPKLSRASSAAKAIMYVTQNFSTPTATKTKIVQSWFFSSSCSHPCQFVFPHYPLQPISGHIPPRAHFNFLKGNKPPF